MTDQSKEPCDCQECQDRGAVYHGEVLDEYGRTPWKRKTREQLLALVETIRRA